MLGANIWPHPRMRGPCRPRKTLSDAYPAIILQWSLSLHIFLTTLLSFWGQHRLSRLQTSKFFWATDPCPDCSAYAN